MKLNKFLVGLIIAAIAIFVILGFYQIFLKPPETVPSQTINPIDQYYGEDVINFMKQTSSNTTNTTPATTAN